MSHRYHPDPQDRQQGSTGKVDNDSNKQGNAAPTQKHEGSRTPQSRSDREAQVGGTNQSKMRSGSPQGDGRGDHGGPPKGGGRG